MKIFSTAPEGNEMAELENARYINLAIKQIDQNIEWLKTTDKPTQAVLTHIDILVWLARRFNVNANLLIKKDKVQDWKKVFNEWFDRCGHKIPTKFREGIKTNSQELFKELEQYGH
ncbi:hypothetical protein [Prevotella aurantiaca]|uniref:hypothetical protein n=1 Tax=Prevotella aurantiaca TaxID=596085 RepID=UPI0028E4CC7A|nr:hypothetical protein [Prevotella aurantiaca]